VYRPTAHLVPHLRGIELSLIDSLYTYFHLSKLPPSNLEQQVAKLADSITVLRRRLKCSFNLRILQDAAEVSLHTDRFTRYQIKPLHTTLKGVHRLGILPKTHRFSRPQLQVMRRVACPVPRSRQCAGTCGAPGPPHLHDSARNRTRPHRDGEPSG
jgi:hypothetical protein